MKTIFCDLLDFVTQNFRANRQVRGSQSPPKHLFDSLFSASGCPHANRNKARSMDSSFSMSPGVFKYSSVSGHIKPGFGASLSGSSGKNKIKMEANFNIPPKNELKMVANLNF